MFTPARYAHPYVLTLLLFCLAACGGGGGSGGGNEIANAPPAPASNNQSNSQANPPPLLPEPSTEIKLLALYSDGVTDQFTSPDLRISHLVNVANDVMASSGVDVEFTLAHIEWVDYPDHFPATQALDDMTFSSHAAFEGIDTLRDNVAADLVVLIRPYANDGHCGYAWIGGYGTNGDFSAPVEAEYGFSVVASNCSDYTLIHELGHNMGLAHSRREAPNGGTFPYAVGYGLDSDFVTIMASPDEFAATQLPKLSSPQLTCNGNPCGVARTDNTNGSDAVHTLNISKQQIAAYR